MPQSENLQESLRRAIQQRPPQVVRAADDSHQVAIQQLPQNIAALHPANRFDLGPQHRLPIGDHRQALEGRRREPRVHRRPQQPPQPRTEHRPRQKLKAAGQFLDPKCTPPLIVKLIQPANQGSRFRAVRQAAQLSNSATRQRLVRKNNTASTPASRRSRASGRSRAGELSRAGRPPLPAAGFATSERNCHSRTKPIPRPRARGSQCRRLQGPGSWRRAQRSPRRGVVVVWRREANGHGRR